jgi:hypothetical protein
MGLSLVVIMAEASSARPGSIKKRDSANASNEL